MKQLLLLLVGLGLVIWLVGCDSPSCNSRPILYCATCMHCAPCQADKPILKQIDILDKVSVVMVDADEYPGWISQMNIQSLPEYIYMVNGAEYWREKSAMAAYRRIVQGQ